MFWHTLKRNHVLGYVLIVRLVSLLFLTVTCLSKGNELVEAILDGPIVVIKDPRTEKNRVIDPGLIGRQIMHFRSKEAERVIQVSK